MCIISQLVFFGQNQGVNEITTTTPQSSYTLISGVKPSNELWKILGQAFEWVFISVYPIKWSCHLLEHGTNLFHSHNVKNCVQKAFGPRGPYLMHVTSGESVGESM